MLQAAQANLREMYRMMRHYWPRPDELPPEPAPFNIDEFILWLQVIVRSATQHNTVEERRFFVAKLRAWAASLEDDSA